MKILEAIENCENSQGLISSKDVEKRLFPRELFSITCQICFIFVCLLFWIIYLKNQGFYTNNMLF